jgi:hypothetical protein
MEKAAATFLSFLCANGSRRKTRRRAERTTVAAC